MERVTEAEVLAAIPEADRLVVEAGAARELFEWGALKLLAEGELAARALGEQPGADTVGGILLGLKIAERRSRSAGEAQRADG